MKEYKFGFVILHYNTYETTMDCINMIEKFQWQKEYMIIVVDNFSPNKSGKKLEQEFVSSEHIKVYLLDENIGFARANNVGIKYAKDYGCDFVCCLNNDVFILDENFIGKSIETYEKHKAALIGPKIILRDGQVQPLRGFFKKKEEYVKILQRIEADYNKICENGKVKFSYRELVKRVLPKKILRTYKKDNPEELTLNPVLHGCCIIFTPVFFSKCEGFNPRTFLYGEEELLMLSLIKNKMTTVYNPNITVKHLEDISTNTLFDENITKIKFVLKHQIDSYRILIEEYEK